MKKLLVIASLLLVPCVASAGDPELGKAKAVVCAGCHGANGISAAPTFPNLAGQKEQYLVSAITAYREGNRTGGLAGTMSQMASALSDEDIANVAAYFASLKP